MLTQINAPDLPKLRAVGDRPLVALCGPRRPAVELDWQVEVAQALVDAPTPLVLASDLASTGFPLGRVATWRWYERMSDELKTGDVVCLWFDSSHVQEEHQEKFFDAYWQTFYDYIQSILEWSNAVGYYVIIGTDRTDKVSEKLEELCVDSGRTTVQTSLDEVIIELKSILTTRLTTTP